MPGWGPMNPNTQHQLWSRWKFRVWSPKNVGIDDIRSNAARWLKKGFGSVGQARVMQEIKNGLFVSTIEAMVEGATANDPGYVESVRLQFCEFVEKGWGTSSFATTEVEILAGDVQDGKPRAQMLVLPTIIEHATENGE